MNIRIIRNKAKTFVIIITPCVVYLISETMASKINIQLKINMQIALDNLFKANFILSIILLFKIKFKNNKISVSKINEEILLHNLISIFIENI